MIWFLFGIGALAPLFVMISLGLSAKEDKNWVRLHPSGMDEEGNERTCTVEEGNTFWAGAVALLVGFFILLLFGHGWNAFNSWLLGLCVPIAPVVVVKFLGRVSDLFKGWNTERARKSQLLKERRAKEVAREPKAVMARVDAAIKEATPRIGELALSHELLRLWMATREILRQAIEYVEKGVVGGDVERVRKLAESGETLYEVDTQAWRDGLAAAVARSTAERGERQMRAKALAEKAYEYCLALPETAATLTFETHAELVKGLRSELALLTGCGNDDLLPYLTVSPSDGEGQPSAGVQATKLEKA
ncbi:MAG TPA: hypothetical protein VJJ22_02590 [Candidatus Paceibacterota bacterium]